MRSIEEIQRGPLRLYSFVNYYLSDLQRGLQTAHLVSDLFSKYKFKSCGGVLILGTWAHEHKTIMILNGGNCYGLSYIHDIIQEKNSGYPFDFFTEDVASLNGALTCVGIIFPEFTKEELDSFASIPDDTDHFVDIMRLIRSHPLA